MHRITVIADDMTGALDTGVCFAEIGHSVAVVWQRALTACEVLVVDSETRNCDPLSASCLVMEMASLARGLVYKKIDSTLRGPVVAEVQALARALGSRGVLIAPAFPGAGRTVVGGRLLVDGVPVSETPFARDPRWPIWTSNVGELLRAQGCAITSLLTLERVRQGAAAVGRVLDETSGTVIADAQDERDLVTLAGALSMVEGWLPVGSAGLAGAIARCIGPARHVAQPISLEPPALFVCGSAHPVSRAQFHALASEVGLSVLIAGFECPAAIARRASEHLRRRGVAIVATPMQRLDCSRAKSSLADLVRAVVTTLRDNRVGFVFVTGGETLVRLVRMFGFEHLEPVSQFTAGVVLSRGHVREGRWLHVVSKAGGFGEEELLVRLWTQAGRRGGAGGYH